MRRFSAAPPRALLFDWDNTLVDSWQVIHRALTVTFDAFGRRPWTLEEVRRNVRASARDAFPKLFGEDAEAAMQLFYEAFSACHLEEIRELPGAGATLAALRRQGLYLGVVSNKTGRYLRQEAAALGWDGLLHRLVGATDAPRDKPAPDPVLLSLKGSGIGLGPEVWLVGDTDIDMLCARNAGCTAVLLRKEAPAEGEFPAELPPLHVADFEALLSLVAAAGGKLGSFQDRNPA